jgi:hypothetical protein
MIDPTVAAGDRDTTPLQWQLTQRIAHARELLDTTTMTVETVAHRCGFGDAPTLRRHFTPRVGTSPLAYRSAFSLDPTPEAAGRSLCLEHRLQIAQGGLPTLLGECLRFLAGEVALRDRELRRRTVPRERPGDLLVVLRSVRLA